MDIVSIKCPNCGGMIKRQPNEYFARCQYCGGEVCFDEIKEEAVIGEYADRIEELERDKSVLQSRKKELKNWSKARNCFLGIMSICNLIGFVLIGASDGDDSSSVMILGAILVIIAITLFFAAIPILAAVFPSYDAFTGEKESGGRVKMLIKLYAIGLSLGIISSFSAYIILSFTGRLR